MLPQLKLEQIKFHEFHFLGSKINFGSSHRKSGPLFHPRNCLALFVQSRNPRCYHRILCDTERNGIIDKRVGYYAYKDHCDHSHLYQLECH